MLRAIESWLPDTVSPLELIIFLVGMILISFRAIHWYKRYQANKVEQERGESGTNRIVAKWLLISDSCRLIIKGALLGLIIIAMTRANNTAFDPYQFGSYGNTAIYLFLFLALHAWGKLEDYYTRLALREAWREVDRRSMERTQTDGRPHG